MDSRLGPVMLAALTVCAVDGGTFRAGSPNRLAPAPGGFVYTTGTVTLGKQ